MSPPASPDPVDHSGSTRVRHRIGWILFVALGALFCLGMGYWQLSRYQSATGNGQNLGYTFMWPFLAGFLVYTYLRYVRLEAREAGGPPDTAAAPSTTEVTEPSPARRERSRPGAPTRPPTAIPDDILPRRPRTTPDPSWQDETLQAYNDHLAELHRRDSRAPTYQESRTP